MRIRKDESYEKNYLIGKYGAIPTLKSIDMFKGAGCPGTLVQHRPKWNGEIENGKRGIEQGTEKQESKEEQSKYRNWDIT